MKNEAEKFFQDYFKVHEQDMVMYDDTIDCMVKFAEKVNNPDVSKMAYWYLRSHIKELQNKLRIASDELKRRDASIETTSNNKPKLNDIGLKRGDYVVYIGGSESQYLTKNKQYRLTGEPYRNRICIINDKGNRMNCKQSFFNAL